MSVVNNADHLPAGNVQRLLLMLLLIAGPHFLRMPLWAVLLVGGVGIWRAIAARRTWAMPRPFIRIAIALSAFIGIWVQYQTINGHYAGVALLVVMLGMKLMEMNRRRDYLLVIYLSYFLLVTHFLFSQDMQMMIVLFLGTLAITVVLVDVNHAHSRLPLRRSAKIAGTLLLQAVPLMLVFFVLFPRIPGPLWGLPSNSGDGMSGLSNSMEPGAISNLSMSDEVAFRVRFQGDVPPRQKLYWRGPVFEFFNGRSWLPGNWNEEPRDVQASLLSDPVHYEIQLEPHGARWMLALDVPVSPLPAQASLGPELVLRHRYDISDKQLFQLASVLDYRVDVDLPERIRLNNLSLASGNPKARALAQQWRTQSQRDTDIVDAALRMYRQEGYNYTLQPPRLLSADTIDQFLFSTRSGFCEHFASSFTFLMRAAGVPARVVTGYQGAEPNGDYYIVRQSDAHAWAEVWLAGEGWVRIDPTGAVSPDRIDLGLGAAMPEGEPVPGLARGHRNALIQLRLQWDQVNALWNRWVLAYGPELQAQFLAAMGLPSLRAILIALTVGIVGALLIVGWLVSRAHVSLDHRDEALQYWRRFQKKLQKGDVFAGAHVGPQDQLQLIAEQKPAWHESAAAITKLYVQLRYAGQSYDALLLTRLRQRVRKFPQNLP